MIINILAKFPISEAIIKQVTKRRLSVDPPNGDGASLDGIYLNGVYRP